MKTKNIPEILSPAGSKESAFAAINNGCDAIYLGGKNFNARDSAENFTNKELIEIIDTAHLRGVKVYLTVNTLYKDAELSELFEFLNKIYVAGIDAFIVQDIGVAVFIKKHFDKARLHASTQLSTHNLEGVQYLESLGFDRVILARELSIEEIEYISNNSNMELEIFVHGALCVSYSGQCLISSMIGQRSGNRGKCAQTCRMKYTLTENQKPIIEDYLLSPKDINTLSLLPKLIKANVTSLKIEGRMKKPEYVTFVTKVYKEHLEKANEEDYSVDLEDYKKLIQVFNRGGGFSTGYFENYSNRNMMSIISPKHIGLEVGKVVSYNTKTKACVFFTEENLIPGDGIFVMTQKEPFVGTGIEKNFEKDSRVSVFIDGNINIGDKVFRSFSKEIVDETKALNNIANRKIEIKGNIKAVLNEPLEITFYLENIKITEKGSIIEGAKKNPTTKEDLIDRMGKLGNTTFTVDFSQSEIDDNIFVPNGEVNKLKRLCIENFEIEFLKKFKREKAIYTLENEKNKNAEKKVKQITVLARNKMIFDSAVKKEINSIYLENTALKEENINYYLDKAKTNNIKLFIALPTITRLYDELSELIQNLEKTDISGYLIRNYGQSYLLKNSKKEIIINYNFNVYNRLSNELMINRFSRVCLSLELNLEEINNFVQNKNEIVIYGKVPLMTITQCPVGIYIDDKSEKRFCKKRFENNKYTLVDKTETAFPLITNCDYCFAEIFNSNTIFVLDKYIDFKNNNAEFFRLEFLDEDSKTIERIIDTHLQITNNKSKINLGKAKEELTPTYGHFYRGIL